jgi:hypothetical protein
MPENQGFLRAIGSSKRRNSKARYTTEGTDRRLGKAAHSKEV